nr:metallopeptidase TldD-related protein [Streptomyces harenosi]
MAETVLGLSRGDECVVVVEETTGSHLRWANNTVTTGGSSRHRLLTVIAVRHHGDGSASTGVVRCSDPSRDRVEQAVRAAEAAAAATAPVPGARSPGGACPGGTRPDPRAAAPEYGAPAARPEGRLADRLPRTLGRAFRSAAAEDRLLYGFAEQGVRTTWLATSGGLRLRGEQPFGRVEMTAKSSDLARSAWAGVPLARPAAEIDPAAMAGELLRTLGRCEARRELSPGRYEVLLSPSAAGEMALNLYRACSARSAYEGRGPFAAPGAGTRAGERLSAYPLTLRSDPGHPGVPCLPFTVVAAPGRDASVLDNGRPLGPTAWVDAGVLSALVQTRESAVLTGLPFTPGGGNLILEGPGEGSMADLVARTERGLLVTSLWYVRMVDPAEALLTGVTRDGVYLIEDGEVVAEAGNFRFDESPVAMLGRVTETGTTTPTLSREWDPYAMPLAAPPTRVRDFHLSSVSRST